MGSAVKKLRNTGELTNVEEESKLFRYALKVRRFFSLASRVGKTGMNPLLAVGES